MEMQNTNHSACEKTSELSFPDILQMRASENTIILRNVPIHKSFSERLAEHMGEITICAFDWGERKGKELF